MSILSPELGSFFVRSVASLWSQANLPMQLTYKLRHFSTVRKKDSLFFMVLYRIVRKLVLVAGIFGPMRRSNIFISYKRYIDYYYYVTSYTRLIINQVIIQDQPMYRQPQPQPLHPQIQTSIKIKTDKLQSEFQCTICLNTINDAYITRCGHVYCRACIEEAVGRHHRCPFCNQEIKEFKNDVFKNYHFNTIRKIVEEEKKGETDKYLGKVFASDEKSKIQAQEGELQDLLRPIEKKIVENCQSALLQYRKFTLTLFQLEKQAQEKKALHGATNIRDHKTIIKSIQDCIMENFPNPVIAPQIMEKSTQIHISLPGNKVNKNVIKIAPMATFETLLPYIDRICSENNLMLEGSIGDELTINGVPRSLKDRIGTLSGTVIKIQKGIPFQQKVYCFTYNWEKQKSSAFYSCKTCSTKWICQNCALHCHNVHEYQLQIKEHKSDWAMCYCVTKCECKALNKNKMENQ